MTCLEATNLCRIWTSEIHTVGWSVPNITRDVSAAYCATPVGSRQLPRLPVKLIALEQVGYRVGQQSRNLSAPV